MDLDRIEHPENVSLETWLLCFPSYGFLLAVSPESFVEVQRQFGENSISCSVVGEMKEGSQLVLKSNQQSHSFWDLKTDNFILN